MALHRDIYWVGKQWAVTGYGIQACNQKQKGQFDIAAWRLWEDGVQDSVRRLDWVNAEDFDTAVAVAGKYYPEPPRKTAPPIQPSIHLAPAPEPEVVRSVRQKFYMRFEGVRARLWPVWRISTRVEKRPNGQ